MINKEYLYAVVGASQDENKYGFKVLKDLLDAKYDVIPINPQAQEILGLKVYPNLKSVAQKIDVVIFVVPPKITLEILKEVVNLKIKKIWMQPGSESKEAIEYCKNHKIDYVAGACIMIQKNNQD